MIDAIMIEAGRRPRDIDLVAVGRGPGSFTGVRIAATVAQGIAMAHALPLVPVSSLAALAAGAARLYGARSILAALDARRDEIYLGAYRNTETGLACVSVDQVLPPGALELPSSDEAWFAVGHGWDAYAGRFSPACAKLPRLRLPYPLAEDVARLARAAGRTAQVSVEEAMPIYLRAALN